MAKKRWLANWASAALEFVTLGVYFPDQLPCVLAAMVATITTTLLMSPRS